MIICLCVGDHTSTQTSSGHFPEEGFGKANHFKNIQILYSSNSLSSPKGIETYTEGSSYYNAHNDQNVINPHYLRNYCLCYFIKKREENLSSFP